MNSSASSLAIQIPKVRRKTNWVFVELISFGDLTYLIAFYDELYSDQIVNNKFMNTVRDMRNAAAHSNCLINKLFEPLNPNQQIDSTISNYVKKVSGISSSSRAKNLNYRIVYSFVTLLYIYGTVVPDGKAKTKRHQEIQELFGKRMIQHADYFKSNTKIKGIYGFVKKWLTLCLFEHIMLTELKMASLFWKEGHIRKVLSLLIFWLPKS